MQKKYTKKYIKEAIKYWTKRLDEAEAEIDIDKPSDYHDILGLGPDEITGLFMGALIVCNNKTGECPYCKSRNIDFSIRPISDDIATGDIWCSDCKRAYHISRIKNDPKIIKNIDVPKGLIY